MTLLINQHAENYIYFAPLPEILLKLDISIKYQLNLFGKA